jgi:hypothetical protein
VSFTKPIQSTKIINYQSFLGFFQRVSFLLAQLTSSLETGTIHILMQSEEFLSEWLAFLASASLLKTFVLAQFTHSSHEHTVVVFLAPFLRAGKT